MDPGSFVVVGLGARKAKKKPSALQVIRWARHFAEHWGKRTVLLWTPGSPDNKLYPGDDDLARDVLGASAGLVVPFQGELKQAIGIIWNAGTSIVPDSGLMHFAAASPGGVLGLFANRTISPSPEQWGPLGPKALCLESQSEVPAIDDGLVFCAVERLLHFSSDGQTRAVALTHI
jgi:ADP-heptose:LPS heptosyltransferase